ncbi:glycosyltransferase family 4 protein [Streptomyces sp. NPDC058657]|uniref:glycosyltransferase family 4 protein n=1 Tax=unclassified Streptomyces TaxID=2593676 RepID=UPI003665291E
MPQHVPPTLHAAKPLRSPRPPDTTQTHEPPSHPRRIVFLSRRDLDNPAAGGSELLIDRLADGLTTLGHQVTLLCGGPAAYRNYRVVSAGGDLGHFLRAPSAFNRQVGGCDLLVEVCNGLPYLTPLWHRGPTLCLVNHVHTELWGMRFPGPAAALGRRLEHWALSAAQRDNLLVAVSASTANALGALGVDRERIRVVHNGVEEPGVQTPRAAEPVFLAMGRLVEYKRIDLLLRLWERVRPVTGGKLVIVGDGPERERLEAMAGPDVIFKGYVSEAEKHQLLCASWLLLHPSAVEGWGLVVTEAATRATPSIGFDVPGLRDSIEDGVTGVLARGESSFAAAWCALTLHRERREAMGRAAAARAESYRWSSTVGQFRAVAAEAASRHAQSPARTPKPPAPRPAPSGAHPAPARAASAVSPPGTAEAATLR